MLIHDPMIVDSTLKRSFIMMDVIGGIQKWHIIIIIVIEDIFHMGLNQSIPMLVICLP